MGQLVESEVDFAASSLSRIHSRTAFVDFIRPFFLSHWTLVVRNNKAGAGLTAANLDCYHQVFVGEVWYTSMALGLGMFLGVLVHEWQQQMSSPVQTAAGVVAFAVLQKSYCAGSTKGSTNTDHFASFLFSKSKKIF